MKNSLLIFSVALAFALLSPAPGYAGEINQRAKVGEIVANNLAVERDGDKTAGFLKSVDGGNAKAEAMNFSSPSAQPNMIHANLAPAQKIQMSPPALDLIKTKFEGPNLMEEEGIKGGYIGPHEIGHGALSTLDEYTEKGLPPPQGWTGEKAVLPEVGDEVLVAFVAGDDNVPVVIGSVWNSKDKHFDEKSNGQEDIFAMMLQMYGEAEKEKRHDSKQIRADKSAEMKLKEGKLDQEKQQIDEMKEEAGEKYDAAMTAANNELVVGIASSSAAVTSAVPQFYKSKTQVASKVDLGPKLGRVSGDKTPALLRPRAKANEASAISSMRTLVSSQAMFYQGEGEDGTHDYGTTETPPSEDPATADSGKDEDDDSK